MPALVGRLPGKAILKAGAFLLLSLSVWSQASDLALMLPKVPNSLLLDIAAAGNRLVAVGERGHILYSSDQGEHWVQAQVHTAVMLTLV